MQQRSIVLFDGYCKFCHAGVRFIMQRDTQQRFVFVPLQDQRVQQFIQRRGLVEQDTFIVISHGCWLLRSDAALAIARRLSGPWHMLFLLILVPRPLRDAAYRLLAQWRYRIFGRFESCQLPSRYKPASSSS